MSAPKPFEMEVRFPVDRTPRRGAYPSVSVVVASNRDRALLRACLAALTPQCERASAELIVARAGTPGEVDALARLTPRARFIAAPPDASIPQLRGLGMAEARGDVIALTEDHCVADPGWLETLVRSAAEGADVIGGGMENAQRERSVDWAAYFAEYGLVAPLRPDGDGASPLLSGANVAYRRSVVGEVVEWARQGEWETVAHNRLLEQGSAMRFIRTAAVYQNENYRFGAFLLDRYRHGRNYARRRLAEEPETSRLLRLAASPALPALLTWRVARAAGATRWKSFFRALPATVAFLTAWSVGEAVGYARGPAAPGPKRSPDPRE